tara:strand:+ start:6519 stop:8006 length:1488 start_codon:yes stop_codon:yes gene_type:complete
MLEYNPHIVIFTDVTSEGFGRYAGPYKIASELRQHGFIVQVIEYFTRWSTRDLKIIIKKFVTQDTLWVGVSTTFLAPRDNSVADYVKLDLLRHRDSSFYDKFKLFPYQAVVGRNDWPEITDFIRTINENCKLVMGGHRINFSRDTIDPYIDYIISGEGESSALFLSLELQKNKTLPKILSEPYTDYSRSVLRYEDNDLIFPKEHLPIEVARGCIFKCAFCSYALTGKKLWEFNRNPHLVREEIELAYEKFGSTGFMFCDDTYNDSPEKVIRFHQEFKKLKHKIEFSAYARLDLIISHWETANLLYESGLRSVYFGVESLNHESAKSVGKGMHPKKLKDGLYKLKESYPDLVISLGMILGLPYDTEETLRKNHEWFLESDCPVDCVSYSPFYIEFNSPFHPDNSKISKNPDKYGYKVYSHNKWTRNDGVTFDDMLKLDSDINNCNRSYKGNFTYFNRLQNIGYTYEDMSNDRINTEDIIRRENLLFKKYRSRLASL